jgi:LacI family transcriptional regulator
MARPRASGTTILDLAREAGVSKSTVSLVLNGSPLVGADKRARVEAVIRATGYVYNRTAARLRTRTADVIGMVINDLANPFFAEMALGIEAAARGRGVMPFVANAAEDPARQHDLARAMFERGAVGLILSPATGTSDDDIERITAWGAPVVLGIRALRVPGVSAVIPDNRAGAAAAVRHLVALGHRRIAFVGGTAGMVAREQRFAGYAEALRAAGLRLDPALVHDAPITREGGAEAMERLLRAAPDTTALLAFNDLVAIGVLHALEAHGRLPGRDFAVVGFDDVAEARWVRPALTTVSIDARGLGVEATDLLFDLLDGQPPRRVERPARLMIRASCGAEARGRAA